jgi:tetratricopeptide (TPR) repeat protein
LATLALLAAAGSGAWWWRARVPAVPAVDTNGVDPADARTVSAGQARVRAAPRDGTAWGRLGEVYMALTFRKEARACFDVAERLAPRDPRWPYLSALLPLGDPPAATEARLRRAAGLCPNDRPDTPRLALAEFLLTTGRGPEAAAEYESVLRWDPANARAHLGLCRIRKEEGDLAAARRHADAACANQFTLKGALALRAELNQRAGDAAAAARDFDAFNDVPSATTWPDPFIEEVVRFRAGKASALEGALQLIRQGRLDEANALTRRLVRDYPDDADAWQTLGHCLTEQGRPDAAEQALLQALRLAPDLPEVHFELGVARSLRGDYAAAADDFRRAVALKPDYAFAYFNLGHCLKEQGDRAGAARAFRRALGVRPFMAAAHLHLGSVLMEDGQAREGLDHLRLAVQLSPQDEEAKKRLAEAEARAKGP